MHTYTPSKVAAKSVVQKCNPSIPLYSYVMWEFGKFGHLSAQVILVPVDSGDNLPAQHCCFCA